MKPILAFEHFEADRPNRFWRVVLQFIGSESNDIVVRYIEDSAEVTRIFLDEDHIKVHSIDEYSIRKPKHDAASVADHSKPLASPSRSPR